MRQVAARAVKALQVVFPDLGRTQYRWVQARELEVGGSGVGIQELRVEGDREVERRLRLQLALRDVPACRGLAHPRQAIQISLVGGHRARSHALHLRKRDRKSTRLNSSH